MPRLSRGCLRCRQRRVKCDEGRPSCMRCITRNELCVGYRDEMDLVLRHETAKVISAMQHHTPPDSSPEALSPVGELASQGRRRSASVDRNCQGSQHRRYFGFMGKPAYEPSPFSSLIPTNQWSYPWLKRQSSDASLIEQKAVDGFFDKYVVYPCNHSSSSGFLEHLPVSFKEVNITGRCALRWAVLAAGYADSSRGGDATLSGKAFKYYGQALTALGRSLSEKGKIPDDYDLMTVVVLDIFETLFIPEQVRRNSHAEGMAHILRLRGVDQFHDPRGWGLFRLALHRLQQQRLAFKLDPLPESEEFLGHLNDQMSYVRLEKDALEISKICTRGRELTQKLNDEDLRADEILALVREMHKLDQSLVSYRRGSEWTFKTINKGDLDGDAEILAGFPEQVELHSDVWNAYEWNYHRTARILMHEQLLACLHRAAVATINREGPSHDAAIVGPLEEESIRTIRSLAQKILSTVPQMLGDIDHCGIVRRSKTEPPRSRAIGAYFLLWPSKIIKGQQCSATTEQKASAKLVFERIREYTGMKSHLGDLSSI